MKMLRGAAGVAAIAASMASMNAGAVNLSTDGIGEVAIAPYYTVRDGWSTLINLTNTSSDPILVKVRFHEGLNSRDVLDFNVAMSGNDVFVGLLEDSANGPVFRGTDSADSNGRITCTIPSSVVLTPQGGAVVNNISNANTTGVAMSTAGFSGSTLGQSNSDGGPSDVDRLREGYIEFIVMGRTVGNKTGSTNAVGAGSTASNIGNAIEQHDCAELDTALGTQAGITAVAPEFGEPVNALKFNFRLINTGRGVEAGNTATTWANFYNEGGGQDAPLDTGFNTAAAATFVAARAAAGIDNTCVTTRGAQRQSAANTVWVPSDGAAGSCPNLVTLQQPNAFLDPSLNDAFPPTANWWDDQQNAAVTLTSTYVSSSAATAAAPGGGSVSGTNGHPVYGAGGRSRGIDAMSLTIQRSGINQEWTNNVNAANNTGVAADWIVTLPTKGFYVDRGAGVQFGIALPIAAGGNGGAGSNGRPAAELGSFNTGAGDIVGPYPPFQNAFAQTTVNDPTTAKACNEITFSIFDRAEQAQGQAAPGGPVVSPAPLPEILTSELCYEANVITFDNVSALRFGAADGSALNRLRDQNGAVTSVDTTTLPAPGNRNGWIRMNLGNAPARYAVDPRLPGSNDADLTNASGTTDANRFTTDGDTSFRGLPVTGFVLKVRNFNNVQSNFASSTDHGYVRTAGAP